jgi:hypothetical protein
MEAKLQQLVEELYSVFKGRKPLQISNVCTDECCMPKVDAQKLLTLPLKQIDIDLIHQYNDNAQSTLFDNQEFLYFLPRYFHLISQFQFTSGIDISLSLKNLRFEENSQLYTQLQKNKIQLFCSEFVDYCCVNREKLGNENIFGVITMFYTAELNVKIVLNHLLKNLDNGSIFLISDMITEVVDERGKLRKHAFANKELVFMIYEWILSNRTLFKSTIERVIMMGNNSEADISLISNTYDFLDYV